MNSVSREKLHKLYVIDGKTMKAISEELGIAVGKIHRLIHEYEIPVRKASDYEITENRGKLENMHGKNEEGSTCLWKQGRKCQKQESCTAKGTLR